jgi:hypothetical protein
MAYKAECTRCRFLENVCPIRSKKYMHFYIKKISYFFPVLFSTATSAALKFHCVGGCWDRTQDSCDFGIGCQTL